MTRRRRRRIGRRSRKIGGQQESNYYGKLKAILPDFSLNGNVI